jgi:hypothetical protein
VRECDASMQCMNFIRAIPTLNRLLFAIILMMLQSLAHAATCPPAMWPNVIGGSLGDTKAFNLDIKADKLAAFVATRDAGILGFTTSALSPLISMYSLEAG